MQLTRRSLLAATAATLVTRPAWSADAEPIRIGWAQPLTGPNSAPGVGYDRGINFAVTEINARGGVAGRKIELITRDTQGDPTKAVNAIQELISRQRVHVILGPSNSGETLAVTPILARARMPSIHAGTVDGLIDPKKFPNAFRTGASNAQWQGAANNYLVNTLKHKNIAVIADNSGYGTAAAHDSSSDLAKRGANAVYTGLADLTSPDLTAELYRARDAKAEAILAWSASSGFLARLLNARGSIGWDVPVAGHASLGSGEVAHLLDKPEYWNNVFQVGFRPCSYGADGKLPPEQTAFAEKIAGKIKLEDSSFWWIAWGYDAINLVAAVVEKAGSTKSEDMIAQLNATTNFPGLYGHYSFSVDQHNGYPDADVVMSVANSFRNGAYSIAPGA